jgi:hypothetical protein
MAVETSPVTGPINLHLYWYSLIALITHAEDFLVLLSFSCIALSITSVITVVDVLVS